MTNTLSSLLMLLYCLFVQGLIFDEWAGWHCSLQRTYAEILLALTHLDACLQRGAAREEAETEPSDK